MRKALSISMVLLLLLSMAVPASAAGTPTLSISSGEVKAGESITLTVSIKDNPGIAGTKFYIYYDTSVFTSDPKKDVEAVGGFASDGVLIANTTSNARQNDRYEGDASRDGMIIVWANLTDVSSDGAVIKITLHTETTAMNGTYDVTLQLQDGKTCNEKIQTVQMNGSSCTVSVSGGSDEQPDKEENICGAVSGQDRLSDTIILKIGCFGAVAYGAMEAIDPDNHNVTPMINADDRTLVPIRFVAEALGADVGWDSEKRQVTIELNGQTVVMTIGSKVYTIDGKQKSMDTAPEIIPQWDRTMVPIRFVAEALGMAVEWDSVNRLVLITPVDRPWNLEGSAEAEAVSEVYQLLMLQSFL